MGARPKPMRIEAVEAFDELVEHLKRASRRLEGGPGGSRYDRSELMPGFEQLQFHLDRALRWAEEMQWIIDRELLPPQSARALAKASA